MGWRLLHWRHLHGAEAPLVERSVRAAGSAAASTVLASMADSSAAPKTEPETEHPPPQHDAVARSAAAQLVSGAINAAKASALEDEDLAASLRICTLDGVAADDDADGLLAKLAALSVSTALYVTVDGVETRIDSEEALFAALRAAAQSSQPPAFRTEKRAPKRRRDDSDEDAADATKRRRPLGKRCTTRLRARALQAARCFLVWGPLQSRDLSCASGCIQTHHHIAKQIQHAHTV